ncbi:MAG: iron-sulfur cluster assembly scaffold protein [Deltaproteobacteria bacterium]|jgi:NifU-like protein|nr:iron-sulfur cluster assembly scaffold protein [Deltaproteobacteria bacterium]
MPWEYSEKVLELFMAAVKGKPGTHMGELKNPDGIGEHGSIVCGDALRFSFRVKRHPTDPTRDIITEARYLTFGCTSAIAASEALCRLIEEQEKTPIEALKVTNQDLIDFLGGLPEQKIHCSVMGAEALQKAVADWASKRGVDLAAALPDAPHEGEDEGRIVCRCYSVTEPYLRRKIKELGLRSIPDITNALKAGGGCTACHHAPGGLQDLLNDIWGVTSATSNETPAAPVCSETGESLSPYRLGRLIEEVIEQEIRPALHQEGGDLELIDIKEHKVYCRLTGSCRSCTSASQTLKLLVEQKLKDGIDNRLQVIAV